MRTTRNRDLERTDQPAVWLTIILLAAHEDAPFSPFLRPPLGPKSCENGLIMSSHTLVHAPPSFAPPLDDGRACGGIDHDVVQEPPALRLPDGIQIPIRQSMIS